jgi:hypothetical protein
MTSDLLRSQVCRSSEEILNTHKAEGRDDREGLDVGDAGRQSICYAPMRLFRVPAQCC